HPWAGVIQATDAAFYGTTVEGGSGHAGTVFRLAVGCEASVQVLGDVHAPGSPLPVRIHIAHNRQKTVTVPLELSLIDPKGKVVAERVRPPYTFEPGDVLDVDLVLPLP